MKRVYQWSAYYECNELIGYEYKGYYIEIEEQFTRGIYGNTKKWYITTLKSGEKTGSDLLKDVKRKIDEELEKEGK